MAIKLIPMDRRERGLLTFTSVAHAVSDAWHLIFPSLLFLIALEYNNFFFLGVLANVIVVSRALSGVIAGFLTDRFSTRLMFVAFALLSALGSFMVFFFSRSEGQLAVSLFVLGVGMGIYHPVGLSAITGHIRRRSEALGIHEAAGSIGLSVFTVVLISIGVALGWRASFLFAGAVSLLLVPLIPLVPKEFDRPQVAPAGASVTATETMALLAQRHVIALFVSAALLDASLLGFTTFLPTAIALIGGLGQSQVLGVSITGLFVSLVLLVGALGSFTGGKIGERLKPERAFAILTLAPIPFLLLLGGAKGGALLALVALTKLPYGAAVPLLNNLVGRSLPTGMQGKAFAVLYGLNPVVGSLATLLAGAIAQRYGLNWVFPVMAVFLLAVFPIAFFLLRPAQHEPGKPR